MLRFIVVGLIAAAALLSGRALADGTPGHSAGRQDRRAHHASLTRAERARLLSAYGRLPLSYDANRGQFDRRVAFAAHAGGSTLALTSRGALLAVPRRSLAAHGARARRASFSVLGLTLVGARRGLWPVGVARQPGTVNYLIGNDRSRWHTRIPIYSRARYGHAWPGIDVTFSGVQRQIEYAFTLNPGADPRRIAMRLTGARSLRIDHSGDLLVRLPGGAVVRELAPHAYQRASDGRVVLVASRYRVSARHVVSIALGAYDRDRALTIDPSVQLSYSTYLGGSGDDSGRAIAVDAAGSAYVTGFTSSANFPTSLSARQRIYGGGSSDAFVTKLSADGSALVYSTYLGGSGFDSGSAIAVDSAGSAYVTGGTSSADFPTTQGAWQRTYGGNGDAFVTKLSADGAALVYSTYLGGSANDSASAIAVDSAGSAYVTGSTSSTDFPTSQGALQRTYGGGESDAFVTKLNAGGSVLVYSTYLGGTHTGSTGPLADSGSGIAVDSADSAYVTGYTNATDFPTTLGARQRTYGGGNADAFVSKLSADGSALTYSTYLGGSGDDSGSAIAVDSAGSAYVTGSTSSTNFPTQGALQTTNGGGINDAFVTKLSADGSALAYSTYLGGSGFDTGSAIAVDSARDAYVTGFTNSTNFPTLYARQAFDGFDNAFVSELNTAGGAVVYSTYLGGTSTEHGNGIAVDSAGYAYVTGDTNSTDFPTRGAWQASYGGGNSDAFVTKLSLQQTTTQDALTVTPGGSGSGTVTSSPAGIACPTTCSSSFSDGTSTTLTAVPAPGSTFAGFSGGGGCPSTGTRCIIRFGSQATTVTATFTLAQPMLTVVPAGSGSGTVTTAPAGIACGSGSGSCNASFDPGTQVTLTAAPDAGSTFAGFSGGGCSGTATTCTVTLSADTTVTATFTVSGPQSTLTVAHAGTGLGAVTSSPAGIYCRTTCSSIFGTGTGVTLTAIPAAGSTFAGFSGGGCSGTATTCTVTLGVDTTVTATFTLGPGQTILTLARGGSGAGTVRSSPAGIDCGTTCAASFSSGTQVTLTAAPASGSTFAGFSGGGCSGTATTCTVTLSAATTVTAKFTSKHQRRRSRRSNRFRFGRVKAGAKGTATVKLRLPGAGKFVLRTSARVPAYVAKTLTRAGSAGTGNKAQTIQYSSNVVAVTKAPLIVTVKIKPDRTGAAALSQLRKLRVTVWVTFTPRGGTRHTKKKSVTVTSSGRGRRSARHG